MLSPVRCLVVDPGLAREVIAPSYDALTPDERDAWASTHPRSWLNCARSDDGSPEADLALMQANRTVLEDLLDGGTFARHDPALYLYRLTDGDHRQTALVGQLPTDVIGTSALRVHEGVQPARVETLRLHLEVVGATSSPVAVTWRSDTSVDTTFDRLTATAPLIDVVDDEGTSQQLWPVTDDAAIARLTAELGDGPLYVVDGHHRSAAAVAFVAGHQPRSEHDRHLLVAAFPMHHLRVAPFHRVLHAEVDVARLHGARRVDPAEVGRGTVAILDAAGGWWQLELGTEPGELDVERLHSTVLEDQLEIGADDPRLEHVAGRDGLDELAGRARGATGFALAPVRMTEILDRADEGRVMPPKATYFHPKVRSGLLVRLHLPGDELRIA